VNIHAQAYDQYKRISVETLAPEKLLLLLFEAAIKDLVKARQAVEARDFNTAHNEIIKVENILVELMSTLNMDYEISKQLYALYDYMYNQLVEANLSKNGEILVEVEDFLRELYDAFQEADRILKTRPHRENQAPTASTNIKNADDIMKVQNTQAKSSDIPRGINIKG
jgi:flagellar protein FliS